MILQVNVVIEFGYSFCSMMYFVPHMLTMVDASPLVLSNYWVVYGELTNSMA